MSRKVLFIVSLFFSMQLNAQTGIGTTTPNASAKLDVYSNNKGFLPPRVILTSATDATTIASPAEGLLVYNLGSVGLQAGYYYWNGTSWATIATASSAGNGVTSSDLVKLYGEAYSTVSGKIAHTNGYSFTVPVSGRYLFDFASSGYANSTDFTMTFKVRQGTTNVGTDAQTSASNTVHVEYNGKVEVNLQAGTTYNVIVISTGIRNSSDFDRVYYKQVAGNLPVTGQTVDYVQASLSTNQSLSAAANINFNVSSGAGITITSGGFNLIANKTYKLEAALGGTSGGYAYYGWVDNTNALLSGGSIGAVMKAGTVYTDAPQDKAVVYFTPTVDTRVFLRVYSLSGTLTAYAPSISGNYSSSWANISQIGSSAIINPWTLSGTNTYNSTGNVGIGTNAPTSKLNIAGGGVRIASGLGNSSTRPSVNTGTIGNYEIRGVGGGASQVDGQDDGFLRLSAGGGTTAIQQTSIDLSGYSATVPDMNSNIVMRTSGVERLRIDASGNVNVTGKINVGDPTGNVITKASGLVNTGSFVTLDNVKVGPTRTGAGGGFAGLSVGAVSTSFVADISGVFSNNAVGGTTATNITYTTTASSSFNGWGFNQGNQSTYILNDTTNSRVYRITLMIGASYNNNFISIERLL
jgi:hypothetical protein